MKEQLWLPVPASLMLCLSAFVAQRQLTVTLSLSPHEMWQKLGMTGSLCVQLA